MWRSPAADAGRDVDGGADGAAAAAGERAAVGAVGADGVGEAPRPALAVAPPGLAARHRAALRRLLLLHLPIRPRR